MTNSQAAKLQLKWKLRSPPIPCPHLKKELGHDEQGVLKGTANCLVCGKEFGRPSSSTKSL